MNKYIKAFNAITNNITADEFIDNIDEIYDKFVKCCPLDEDGDKMTHTEFINITFDANREFYDKFETVCNNNKYLRWADAF